MSAPPTMPLSSPTPAKRSNRLSSPPASSRSPPSLKYPDNPPSPSLYSNNASVVVLSDVVRVVVICNSVVDVDVVTYRHLYSGSMQIKSFAGLHKSARGSHSACKFKRVVVVVAVAVVVVAVVVLVVVLVVLVAVAVVVVVHFVCVISLRQSVGAK